MTLLDLRGASSRELSGQDKGAADLDSLRSIVGADAVGLGLEVLVCNWTGGGQPKPASLRKLHTARVGKKIYPLVTSALGPSRDASHSVVLIDGLGHRVGTGRPKRPGQC